MYKIVYSNQAQIDIDEAISYIAKESVSNAFEYLTRYEDKIELLQLNPSMGVECRNKLIKRDCRVLVHESHIIIYKIDKDKNEIYLIRIYHSSVDYANKVNKENDIDTFSNHSVNTIEEWIDDREDDKWK
jgi:plasmid stabilization system protein ParE